MKTTSLVYKTEKQIGPKHKIYVSIRLNDECKNGHQDFSITGDIYNSLISKADRYHEMGGCIHEEIAKHFPEFKQFIALHLADYDGVPMYAVENGFYILRNGFNNTPTNTPEFKAEFCEEYRITPEQFDILNTSSSQIQYAINLKNLGILDQWKKQAQEAIKTLEGLTGQQFENNSTKSQLDYPTEEQIEEEQKKIDSGYYTPEAKEQRRIRAKVKKIEGLKEANQKEIDKLNKELEVEIWFIENDVNGDNCIYYSHTDKFCFGWREPLTGQQYIDIMEELTAKGFPYMDKLQFKSK